MEILHVVGWGVMQGDETCHFCGGRASLYVECKNEYDMIPCCRGCVPKDAPDLVDDIFTNTFSGKNINN